MLRPQADVREMCANADRFASAGESRDLLAWRARARDAPLTGLRRLAGRSSSMERVRARISRFAPSSAAVLIEGESGTGKELAARALHELSDRAHGPLVTVNCAAVPETLMESELFGYEKGAFTGASYKKPGQFQLAHGGTLFLDEVAEMSLAAQAKLLRVVEDGSIDPLGSVRRETVDVRVISATNQSLRHRIDLGLFRPDLYYRLRVLELRLPPLRDHIDDLGELVSTFMQRRGISSLGMSEHAWFALVQWQYPGNVRELEHVLQQAQVLASPGAIDIAHLPEEIAAHASVDTCDEQMAMSLRRALAAFERQYLLCVLHATDGHRAATAGRLGISRKGLWEKLKKHAIPASEYRGR